MKIVHKYIKSTSKHVDKEDINQQSTNNRDRGLDVESENQRITRIKKQIENGTYVTKEKLIYSMLRLIDDVTDKTQDESLN